MAVPTIKSFLFCLAVATCIGSSASASQLITEAEAALPDQPNVQQELRGMTRGPGIDQSLYRKTTQALTSPLPFTIKFTPRNGVPIDESSIRITYLKVPSIDLTGRLKPYTTADGIRMTDAELPAGAHYVRIDVKDKNDRASFLVMKLDVVRN